MDREAKRKAGSGAPSPAGPGILSAARLGGRRAERDDSPPRSIGWLGSDGILELKSEMGVGRIARKELR